MSSNRVTHVLRHLRQLAAATPDLCDRELLERFCHAREETAFALLVQRHGPMVLSVCRRLIRDTHEAEDAFQATFLVLARKAGAIRKQSSLASWLYGVALRVAAQARLRTARRRQKELTTPVAQSQDSEEEFHKQDLYNILDEELGRLPEKYRSPVILCYFEGKSHEQAALELGCPRTSLSSRLGRARALLHERLTRRGLTLSVTTLAAVLAEQGTAQMLPALLTLGAVRAAMAVGTGEAIAANVAVLAEGALVSGTLVRLRAAVGILLVVGMLAAVGYGASTRRVPDPETVTEASFEPPLAEPAFEEKAPNDLKANSRSLSGIVVDAKGQPVEGAAVWATHHPITGIGPETLDQTVTDAQGRFRLLIPPEWFQMSESWRQEYGVIAHKPGLRPGVVGFSRRSLPPPTGTRLILQPQANASVTVTSPEGKAKVDARATLLALAGDQIQTDVSEEYARQLAESNQTKARATPIGFAIGRGLVSVPEELARRLTGTADAQGRILLPDLAQDDVGGLAIQSPESGSQRVFVNYYPHPRPEGAGPLQFPERVVLRPTGRLTGRFPAPTGVSLEGLLLQVHSAEGAVEGEGNDVFRAGMAMVRPDVQGMFEIPALAAGAIRFQLLYPPTAPYRGRLPKEGSITVKAGQTTKVEIPIEEAIRLTGVIRERGTGKPIVGAGVLVSSGGEGMPERVVTDAEGRYSVRVLPGQVYRAAQSPPAYLTIPRAEAVKNGTLNVPAGKPLMRPRLLNWHEP